MLKIISTICHMFFFVSFGILSAQVDIDSIDNDELIIKGENQIDVPSKPVLLVNKLHSDLEVGTSFSYSPGNFYGTSFYIAPNINYFINPRFVMQAGIALERSNFYSLYENSEEIGGILPMTRALVYAKGSYYLTSRVTLSGTVYKTINDVPKLTKYSSPVNYSQNGAIVGINYKLNNSLSFGFNVQMYNNSFQSQSQSSNYYNPVFGY